MPTYPRDPNALAVLLGTQRSNMTATDPFVAKRRAQIFSGEDELAPSELEQRQIQAEMGGTVSRDMIRDSGIQLLKQKLGLINAEAQAKIQPEIIKGEYGVRSARAAADAAEARRAASSRESDERQARRDEAMMSRLDKTIAATGNRQEDRQQFELENPGAGKVTPPVPAAMYKSVDEARKGYESMANNPVSRFLFGSGRNAAYESSLTAVLDRKGTLAEVQEVIPVLQKVAGATIDEKIANSGIPGLESLDPYERQYLQLKIGR